MAPNRKRQRTNKNNPASQFGDSDSTVYTDWAARSREVEDEGDDLLDTQLANAAAINDLEKGWTEDKERLLEKKWKKKYRLEMLHEAKLTLQEENRQNQIAFEAMAKARLFEEYMPKLEEEARKRITKETYDGIQMKLEPKVRGIIEKEVKAAHQKEVDALKASFEKKIQLTQIQCAQQVEDIKAELIAENERLRDRLKVYEPVHHSFGKALMVNREATTVEDRRTEH